MAEERRKPIMEKLALKLKQNKKLELGVYCGLALLCLLLCSFKLLLTALPHFFHLFVELMLLETHLAEQTLCLFILAFHLLSGRFQLLHNILKTAIVS